MSIDDNLGLREAIARGPVEGTVLVALGSPSGTRAVIGDIMASWMVARGFTALVTDGLVRDSARVRQMALAVWCRGVTPTASSRIGPGSVAHQLTIGGVTISPGDFLVADDDGVVVSVVERVPKLLASAEERLRRDEMRSAAVRTGLAPD